MSTECIVDYANIIESLIWFRDALPHADPPDKGQGRGGLDSRTPALVARARMGDRPAVLGEDPELGLQMVGGKSPA